MGQIVNLRTTRKQARRRQAEQDAASRRLVHGRSRSERLQEQSDNDKARRKLDQHQIGTGEAE